MILRYHVRTELYRAPIGRLRGPRRGADADVIHTFTIKYKVLTFAPHRLSLTHPYPRTHRPAGREPAPESTTGACRPRRELPLHSLSQAWLLEMLPQVWALVIKDPERTRKTLVNPIAARLSTTWSQKVPYWALHWRPAIPTSLHGDPARKVPLWGGVTPCKPLVNP